MKPSATKVLRRLKRGSLTPLQAWRELHIYRLAAAIYDIRKVRAVKMTLRKFRGVPYAEYSL